jgi:energy-converting hydrogenase Eha subunit G
MAIPKYRLGLALILGAVLLTRVAIYVAHPLPGAAPEEIWRGMPRALQGVVLVGWCLFVYGIWTLLKTLVRRWKN